MALVDDMLRYAARVRDEVEGRSEFEVRADWRDKARDFGAIADARLSEELIRATKNIDQGIFTNPTLCDDGCGRPFMILSVPVVGAGSSVKYCRECWAEREQLARERGDGTPPEKVR